MSKAQPTARETEQVNRMTNLIVEGNSYYAKKLLLDDYSIKHWQYEAATAAAERIAARKGEA